MLASLQIDNLRGQAYDGAGKMAGSVNGTAGFIAAQYPLALYIHCASHCLNLAAVKSLQVTSVCNMMGVVDNVFKKNLPTLKDKWHLREQFHRLNQSHLFTSRRTFVVQGGFSVLMVLKSSVPFINPR